MITSRRYQKVLNGKKKFRITVQFSEFEFLKIDNIGNIAVLEILK